MLLLFSVLTLIASAKCSDAPAAPAKRTKPYIFPIPFEMPNRNDRADQCWIRIEDDEIIETIATYCHVALAFLHGHIPAYNSKKMHEDEVDVSLWSEEPRHPAELPVPSAALDGNNRPLLSWKVTTIMDPTTRMRLYVSRYADCKLVMYSREGMSNYKVDCYKLLYFVNENSSGSAVFSRADSGFLAIIYVLLLIMYW